MIMIWQKGFLSGMLMGVAVGVLISQAIGFDSSVVPVIHAVLLTTGLFVAIVTKPTQRDIHHEKKQATSV